MKKKQTGTGLAGILFCILILIALICTACPTNTNTGSGGDAVVTFVNGTESQSVTITAGASVARPNNPLPGTGANTRFRGWFVGTIVAQSEPYDIVLSNDEHVKLEQSAFDFTSRVLKDTTLYADFGFRPGDTGPAGGTIFYRSDAGFKVHNAESNPGNREGQQETGNLLYLTDYAAYDSYTAYYLEAAPEDSGQMMWIQTSTASLPNGSTTRYIDAIGGGRHNTSLIISSSPGGLGFGCPPAQACDTATYGSNTDWFLPSRYELAELLKQRALVPGLKITYDAPTPSYWSSSQYDYQFIWYANFANVDTKTVAGNSSFNVRAVRAFF